MPTVRYHVLLCRDAAGGFSAIALDSGATGFGASLPDARDDLKEYLRWLHRKDPDAPAPDFTEELMWKGFSPDIRSEIEQQGVWFRPSDYGAPYPITRALLEEGRNHLLLGGSIAVGCPVRSLQGAQDPDVPWRHAFTLAQRLPAEDVVLTMIQDGDHRLSRPQDIARIIAAVAEMG